MTVNETFTLGAGSGGTLCTSAGNCAGIGGTGDILNNGQNGPITIGTNDATTLALETSNTNQLTILSTGAASFANTLAVNGGSLTLGQGSTMTGSIVLANATNNFTTTFSSGVPSANVNFTLPVADGSNGDCLQTNSSGILSFGSCTGGPGGGVTSIDGQSGVVLVNNATGAANTITI